MYMLWQPCVLEFGNSNGAVASELLVLHYLFDICIKAITRISLSHLSFSYSKQLHIHMSRLSFFAARMYGVIIYPKYTHLVPKYCYDILTIT